MSQLNKNWVNMHVHFPPVSDGSPVHIFMKACFLVQTVSAASVALRLKVIFKVIFKLYKFGSCSKYVTLPYLRAEQLIAAQHWG